MAMIAMTTKSSISVKPRRSIATILETGRFARTSQVPNIFFRWRGFISALTIAFMNHSHYDAWTPRRFNAIAVSFLVCILMVTFSRLAAGADPFKPETGYVSLFNGKDLTGWGY